MTEKPFRAKIFAPELAIRSSRCLGFGQNVVLPTTTTISFGTVYSLHGSIGSSAGLSHFLYSLGSRPILRAKLFRSSIEDVVYALALAPRVRSIVQSKPR